MAKTIAAKPKIACPACGSTFVYTRVKTQDRVCRACGNVFGNGKAIPSKGKGE